MSKPCETVLYTEHPGACAKLQQERAVCGKGSGVARRRVRHHFPSLPPQTSTGWLTACVFVAVNEGRMYLAISINESRRRFQTSLPRRAVRDEAHAST
jgi:hypothetical protein